MAFPKRVTQTGLAFNGQAFLYGLTGTNGGMTAGAVIVHDAIGASNPVLTMNLSVSESNQFRFQNLEFKTGIYIVFTGGVTEATVELG